MAKQELARNTSVSVGTASVVLSDECFQQRSALIISNTSTGGQIIYISVGQDAVVGNGVFIAPGGVYQDTRDGSYFPTNLQINGISNLAGGTVAIQERILMDSYRG